MILQPRLYIYQITLGKYDLVDKYNFSKINLSKLTNIKILYTTHKFASSSLSFFLFKEFLTQRRSYVTNFLKTALNNFIVTLRGYSVLACLEVLLNSTFLSDYFSVTSPNFSFFINLFFKVSSNNEFFRHLNNTSLSIEKFRLVLRFQTKHVYLKSFISYYFIPYKF